MWRQRIEAVERKIVEIDESKTGRWLGRLFQMLVSALEFLFSNLSRVAIYWLVGLVFMLAGGAYLGAYIARADMTQPEVQIYAATTIAVVALAQSVTFWLMEVVVGSIVGDPDKGLVEEGINSLSEGLSGVLDGPESTEPHDASV